MKVTEFKILSFKFWELVDAKIVISYRIINQYNKIQKYVLKCK